MVNTQAHRQAAVYISLKMSRVQASGNTEGRRVHVYAVTFGLAAIEREHSQCMAREAVAVGASTCHVAYTRC